MTKCFILIAFIVKLVDSRNSFDKSLNVGTVLFVHDDASKELWTLQSVELLKARKHFQRILVPLLLVSQPLNDKNLKSMLKYFDNVYAHVKHSSSDEGTDNIMTAAVSDIIGGFLKFYVLPVTKYAFYGGVVTSNSVYQLNQRYDKIKTFLHTTGAGWRHPDQYMLDNIVIDVAPPPRILYSNYMQTDPCKKFGFFEKTSKGLLIPMPNINWNEDSLTMFLPLKNESLISLMSLDAFNALMRYYNAAKECITGYPPDGSEEFEEKFQSWLVKEVVPHLSDEVMYPGLGGILSLMNIGRFNDKELAAIENSIGFLQQVANACGIKVVHLKKLIIILLLVWICIPASIFLYCQRKFRKVDRNISKLRQRSSSNSAGFVDIEASHNNVWNVETVAKNSVHKSNKKNKKCSKSNTDPILTVNESVMVKLKKDRNSSSFIKSTEPYHRLSSIDSGQPSELPSDITLPTTSCRDHSRSNYTTPCSNNLRLTSQESLPPSKDSELLHFYHDTRSSYIIEPSKTVTLFRSDREKPHNISSHSSFSRTVTDNIEAEAALINAELAASDMHASSRRLDEKVQNPFLFCINEVEGQSSASSQDETTASDKTSILTSKHQFPNLEVKPTVQICKVSEKVEPSSSKTVVPAKASVEDNLGQDNHSTKPSKIPKLTPSVKSSTPRQRPCTATALSKKRIIFSPAFGRPRPSSKSKLPKRSVRDDIALKSATKKSGKLNVTL